VTAHPIDTNGLAPLEVAASVVFGRANRVERDDNGSAGALAAFEAALLPALRRPPCLISFSGGRDSSAVLAVAVALARREGLPEPIPVTAVFPHVPETDEEEWQQHVVRAVEAGEWVRETLDDEADLIGSVAKTMMAWSGLPYPYNLHLQAPLVAKARGGSFVTGLGGDETLSAGSRALAVLTRQARPRPRDVLTISFALAPRRVRRAVLRRRGGLTFPWLSEIGNAELAERTLEDSLDVPLLWDAGLRHWRSLRYVQLGLDSIARLAADNDVVAVHPFADQGFVAALARSAGYRGYPSKTAAMEALFGGLVPTELIARTTKASFDRVLWGRETREFVKTLSPAQLDDALGALQLERLVDPKAVRAHWTEETPRANSFLLLQACWLSLADSEETGSVSAQTRRL
jgi:asparagine synthetase B (glutamine-hydrolysing)